jgi:glyoxylase-like metal-dependent hydrolase (beta-lactamase superfamily II)
VVKKPVTIIFRNRSSPGIMNVSNEPRGWTIAEGQRDRHNGPHHGANLRSCAEGMQMANTPRLRCHVLDTGYCRASEHHMIEGGRRETVRCHSIVALLQHPLQGWLLWDTGYAPRLLDVTRWPPFRLYRWLTPLHLDPALTVAAQLEQFELLPEWIRYVVLSHFHADHLCGVQDFPRSQFITTRSAYGSIEKRRGWRALMRGFIPALLPEDFSQRLMLLPEFAGPTLGALGPTHDFFGDGSVRFVMLPGHACGQMGMLAETLDGPLFFVADGAWMSQAVRENKPPHWITNYLVDDVPATKRTLALLHQFAKDHPEITLIPTHCPETFRKFVGKEP